MRKSILLAPSTINRCRQIKNQSSCRHARWNASGILVSRNEQLELVRRQVSIGGGCLNGGLFHDPRGTANRILASPDFIGMLGAAPTTSPPTATHATSTNAPGAIDHNHACPTGRFKYVSGKGLERPLSIISGENL